MEIMIETWQEYIGRSTNSSVSVKPLVPNSVETYFPSHKKSMETQVNKNQTKIKHDSDYSKP